MKDFKGQVETLLNHKQLSAEQRLTLQQFCQTLHRATDKSKLIVLERLRRFGIFVGKPYNQVVRADIDNFLTTIKSDNQYNNFVTTFKRFFKWLGESEMVNDLKLRNVDLTIPASELLSTEEVIELANRTGSQMYKALILTLYESCARVSEVCSLRVGDVTFSSVRDKEDRKHIIATLNFPKAKGKIAKPPVSISMFAMELKHWLESHPYKDNAMAYIFYSPKFSPKADKPLTGDMVNFILRKAKSLTNIQKRVNPHWLRHSGLSFLANELNYNEQLLMWRAGWKNTTMAKRYVHSGAEIQNGEYLKRLGFRIEEREKEMVKAKPCPHCNQLNPYTHNNCDYCGMPLDLTKYQEEIESKRSTHLKEEVERLKAVVLALVKATKPSDEVFNELLKQFSRTEEEPTHSKSTLRLPES